MADRYTGPGSSGAAARRSISTKPAPSPIAATSRIPPPSRCPGCAQQCRADDDGHDGGGEGRRPGDVQRAIHTDRPVGRYRSGDSNRQHYGERQVGPEDDPPAGQFSDDTTDDESARARRRARRTPAGDRPPPLRTVGGERGQQPQRRRHGRRRGRSLHAARNGQRDDRSGDCGEHSTEGEHGQAHHDRAAVAEAVAQACAEHEQPAEEHRVAGRHQHARRVRRTEVGEHVRQGGDHHGHAHHVDELHETQSHHGDAGTGVATRAHLATVTADTDQTASITAWRRPATKDSADPATGRRPPSSAWGSRR